MLEPCVAVSVTEAVEFTFDGTQGGKYLFLSALEHFAFCFSGTGSIDYAIYILYGRENCVEIVRIFILSLSKIEVIQGCKEIDDGYGAIA